MQAKTMQRIAVMLPLAQCGVHHFWYALCAVALLVVVVAELGTAVRPLNSHPVYQAGQAALLSLEQFAFRRSCLQIRYAASANLEATWKAPSKRQETILCACFAVAQSSLAARAIAGLQVARCTVHRSSGGSLEVDNRNPAVLFEWCA